MRPPFLTVVLVVALSATASAQSPPSEARVRADAVEHVEPRATKVIIRGDGHRELNRGVYEYVLSITTVKPYPPMPGVTVEGYGDIVYQSHGSSYQYSNYRVGDWRFFGIPDPSVEELDAAVEAKQAEAYRTGTLDMPRTITVAEGEESYWHNPLSVTIPFEVTYYRSEGGDFVHYRHRADGGLTRESLDAAWELAIMLYNRTPPEVISREPIPRGVTPMTLKEAVAIEEAEARVAALPEVDVPSFGSGRELAEFVYQAARTDDPAHFEASVRAVFASKHLADGAETALGFSTRTEMLDPAIAALTSGARSFSEVTCATPSVSEESRGVRFHFGSVLEHKPGANTSGGAYSPTNILSVVVAEEAGGYANGRALPSRYVLDRVEVKVVSDADDLAYLGSLDDLSTLCARSAARAAEEAAADATNGARDAVEGAVKEGRRRLGRLLGGN